MLRKELTERFLVEISPQNGIKVSYDDQNVMYVDPLTGKIVMGARFSVRLDKFLGTEISGLETEFLVWKRQFLVWEIWPMRIWLKKVNLDQRLLMAVILNLSSLLLAISLLVIYMLILLIFIRVVEQVGWNSLAQDLTDILIIS